MTRKEVITHPTQETRLQIKYNKKLEGIPTKEVLTLYNQTLKKKKPSPITGTDLQKLHSPHLCSSQIL